MKVKFIFLLFSTLFSREENSKKSSLQNKDKIVVCFVYHRFGDKRYPTTNVPLNDFENHLRYLSENKFQVLTLSEAIDYLDSDNPIQKTAVITIDDGYKSFFTNGLPLLKKYKMPATLFINTKTVGSSDFMDWQQLKKTNESGIEIGNHTHSHKFFLDEAQSSRYDSFEKEIQQSQVIIKQNLDLIPTVFTYPYGEFDERMKGIVKELGFKCASAQNSGVLYDRTDRFQIPRFPMSESYSSLKEFIEKIKMKPLKVRSELPDNTLVNKNEPKPVLTIKLDATDLEVKNLTCFVQGGNCKWEIVAQDENEITLRIQSSSTILTRRRTLYTITNRGKNGSWYWYSHLWINPSAKGE
jgi:peptidoglycan/xylan/chitin deacetylase (PgdA/CDA1 family)